jgi:hypothetical protein
MVEIDTFHKAFRGNFSSLLRWLQLDEFLNVVRCNTGAGWYLYTIGTPAPVHQSSPEDDVRFIAEVDKLLHREHHEDHCGIVCPDSMEAPTMIKIFDPNHLGVSCGFSNSPPLPGWVMSLIPPHPIESRRPLPASRQNWWQTLWT